MKRPSAKTIALVGGTAAASAALGIATKVMASSLRKKPDPFGREPYGHLPPDRRLDISADGVTIACDEFGPHDATTGAVFLHGYSLDRTIWHHQMLHKPLLDDRRLIFYDARHHGRSASSAQDPTDLRILASDLRAVLDASSLKEVILVGHSMGGMTVLEFCREQIDERVKGLVLTNTTYTDAFKTAAGGEIIGLLERLGRFQVPLSSKGNQMLFLRNDLSYLLVSVMGFGKNASTRQVDYVRRLLARSDSPALIDLLTSLRRFDFDEALADVDIPVLVVAGGDDRITTERASRHMASHLQDAELVVFEEAGHLSMMERAAEFNDSLEVFFDKVLPQV